jgi:hypothetical protein
MKSCCKMRVSMRNSMVLFRARAFPIQLYTALVVRSPDEVQRNPGKPILSRISLRYIRATN